MPTHFTKLEGSPHNRIRCRDRGENERRRRKKLQQQQQQQRLPIREEICGSSDSSSRRIRSSYNKLSATTTKRRVNKNNKNNQHRDFNNNADNNNAVIIDVVDVVESISVSSTTNCYYSNHNREDRNDDHNHNINNNNSHIREESARRRTRTRTTIDSNNNDNNNNIPYLVRIENRHRLQHRQPQSPTQYQYDGGESRISTLSSRTTDNNPITAMSTRNCSNSNSSRHRHRDGHGHDGNYPKLNRQRQRQREDSTTTSRTIPPTGTTAVPYYESNYNVVVGSGSDNGSYSNRNNNKDNDSSSRYDNHDRRKAAATLISSSSASRLPRYDRSLSQHTSAYPPTPPYRHSTSTMHNSTSSSGANRSRYQVVGRNEDYCDNFIPHQQQQQQQQQQHLQHLQNKSRHHRPTKINDDDDDTIDDIFTMPSSRQHNQSTSSTSRLRLAHSTATTTRSINSSSIVDNKKPTDEENKRWHCDICREARFDSYVEAFRHENVCKGKQHQQQHHQRRISSNKNPHNKLLSLTSSSDNNNNNNDDDMIHLWRKEQIKGQLHEQHESVSTICSTNNGGSIEMVQVVHVGKELVGEDYVSSSSSSSSSSSNCVTTKWLCSVCKEVSFDRYVDACGHEQKCGKEMITTGSAPKSKQQQQQQEIIIIDDDQQQRRDDGEDRYDQAQLTGRMILQEQRQEGEDSRHRGSVNEWYDKYNSNDVWTNETQEDRQQSTTHRVDTTTTATKGERGYSSALYDRYISLAYQVEDDDVHERERYITLANQTKYEEEWLSYKRREESDDERYVCLA